jgi:hypothetical protein
MYSRSDVVVVMVVLLELAILIAMFCIGLRAAMISSTQALQGNARPTSLRMRHMLLSSKEATPRQAQTLLPPKATRRPSKKMLLWLPSKKVPLWLLKRPSKRVLSWRQSKRLFMTCVKESITVSSEEAVEESAEVTSCDSAASESDKEAIEENDAMTCVFQRCD